MRRTTHKVSNTSWWIHCPDCNKWFNILLKPPGTKIRSNLPTYCKPCGKIRSDKSKMKYHDVLAGILFDELNEAS